MWRERAARCGERLAETFLELRGWEVVDRNARVGRGEIDLVARDRDAIVFVEVKFRTGGGVAAPLEAITRKKREDVAKAAAGYLARRGLCGRAVRFDVIAISWTGDGTELTLQHVRNAFAGGGRQFY